MDDAPPLDITLEQAAFLLALAQGATCRMLDADALDMPFGEVIPRRILTIGQAAMLVPALALLIPKLYPSLLDDEVFASAIRDGAPPSTTIN